MNRQQLTLIPTFAFLLSVLCLTVFIDTAQAKPKSLKAQAVVLLKQYMRQYRGNSFAKIIKIGNKNTYRKALKSAKVEIDRSLSSVALYDPKTNTIKLRKDIRKIKKGDRLDVGGDIWHEVTHKIEDLNGDFGFWDSDAYAERNIEYMTDVNIQLRKLARLEKYAKKGAPQVKLRKIWQSFLSGLEALNTNAILKEYPPNRSLVKDWMGFEFDLQELIDFYKSGKGGRALKQLMWNSITVAPTPTPNNTPTPAPTPTPSVKYYVFGIDAGPNLFVGSDEEVAKRVRCSFDNGGLDCDTKVVGTHLAGPFNSYEEAKAGLCPLVAKKIWWKLAAWCQKRYEMKSGKYFWGCESSVQDAFRDYCPEFKQ